MAVVFSRGGGIRQSGTASMGHAMEHVLVLKITLFTLIFTAVSF